MKCIARALGVAVLLLPLGSALAFAQDKPPASTPTSLFAQGKFAEEEERDFAKATGLYRLAAAAARQGKDEVLAMTALQAADRVERRAAGIAAGLSPDANDAMLCRMAGRLSDLTAYGQDTNELAEAYRDLALYGAYAVPWLEKAIQAPYTLCDRKIESDPPRFVRALAQMSAPEGVAALERQLTSPDPVARRAVVQYSDPERHRAILLRALKDPAEAVRAAAVKCLANAEDPALFEVLAAAARNGDLQALHWLKRNRPDELLRIAAATDKSPALRVSALDAFRNAGRFVPDAAAIDTLLGLARAPHAMPIRVQAMEVLSSGLAQEWAPIAPELARRVEEAVVGAPDAYPPQYVVTVLGSVAGAPSLALMVERTRPEALVSILNAVNRVLSSSGPAQYPALCAALAKAPVPVRGVGSPGEIVTQSLVSWLQATVVNGVPTAEIAKGAKLLPPAARRNYVERVVSTWLQAYVSDETALAVMPRMDPTFVELLREMLASQDQNQRGLAVRGLGASGDSRVLPELSALVTGRSVDGNVVEAVRRLTRSDPERVRKVLQLFLARPSLATSEFTNAVTSALENPRPEEVLAAASAAWSAANAERLLALVAVAVPGAQGSKFLVAHYAELADSAAETRMNVIKRLGGDLYEPALDLLGAALRDPNQTVRGTAGSVFERFKNEQQRVADFEAWRNSDQQSQQTIAELVPLLDSPNTDVVIGAVKALSALKARACYPKLVGLLEKHKANEPVKSAVMQALDQLAQSGG